ncbi:MAG TPA: hypothetical protein VIH59_35815 [Candidatus Tectomicrobia bacterium]
MSLASSGFRPGAGVTEEPHLVEMVVKREHLSDPEGFHDHLGGAIRKRPLLILVEPFKSMARLHATVRA